MSNLDKLKVLLIEQLGVQQEKIVPESKLDEDLGADSLDCVEIVMAIEEEWGISIDTDDSDKFKTVQDLLDYLEANAEA